MSNLRIEEISYITKKSYSEDLELDEMNTQWKSGKFDDYQRTPDITTDIILFHRIFPSKNGKQSLKGELCILAGIWTKEWNGRNISGLTFIPGGHYERMGYRPSYLIKQGADPKGDIDLYHASKKELVEETGINSVKRLTPIAIIDIADNDPRKHVFRSVFAGYTNKTVKPSEEIQVFYSIPVKDIEKVSRQGFITSAYKTDNGKTEFVKEKIEFVLNHDKMMKILLKLPKFNEYIREL